MKIVKNLLLIFFGILLSLIVLEVGLQTVSYINNFTKNTITILCLGESTTDGEWPPILQKILDKKSKNKKFNVIDEGHAGKNSEYIFYEVVEKKLKKYNPDIVISMIGANDALSDKPYIMQNEHWYYKLRIYRLIVLIIDHLSNNIKYSELNNAELNINIPDNIMHSIHEIAVNNNNNVKNLILLKNFIKQYPTIHWYEQILPALVNPYFYEIVLKKRNYSFTLDDFIKYYNLNIKSLELYKIYLLFAKNFFKFNDINNAVKCAKSALLYNNCINSLKDIMEFDSETIYADKFYEEAVLKGYFITPIIYKNIISYCYKNNIKYYIAMQYPTLSVKQLKQDLKDSRYYDKIIFVSNEENFKQSLQNHKTKEIFRDMFGKSFGHCTELGNTLIAENVADTILNLYN